ncbi:MAG: FeoB-associated Cys-rich membrane protein [Lachnospiraceae bacterium]|nr:FeoB-associated Cys-rich membrane protein [Lachnospiraceae bacterium]
MIDIIVTIIIAVVFTGACTYIYKEKKKGTHCIGCPMAGNCAKAKAACQGQKCGSVKG